jgi:hypothetical protein
MSTHTLAPEQVEARDHDKWVEGLSIQTLQAAGRDLLSRTLWHRRDPEHRWGMSRRAAIMRALSRKGATL